MTDPHRPGTGPGAPQPDDAAPSRPDPAPSDGAPGDGAKAPDRTPPARPEQAGAPQHPAAPQQAGQPWYPAAPQQAEQPWYPAAPQQAAPRYYPGQPQPQHPGAAPSPGPAQHPGGPQLPGAPHHSGASHPGQLQYPGAPYPGSPQRPGAPEPGDRAQPSTTAVFPVAGGPAGGPATGAAPGDHGAPTPAHGFPAPGLPAQAPPGPSRGRGRLAAAAAALLLLVGAGGAVGGAVGYELADDDTVSSAGSALDQPRPDARSTSDLPEGSIEQVAQTVLPSVVQLQVVGQGGAGEGSGVVLSADGLILTNNHVIEAGADGGEITVVLQDGRRFPAEIVGRAPTFDLAVVRAQGATDLQAATLGRSDDLVVGQQVLAIGSPLGLSGTVTTGIISSLQRPVQAGGEGSGQETVLDAVQTDAAINPGNSGGPLVDVQGRVIGINSAIATLGSSSGGQSGSIGLGFAIPIDTADRIATELVDSGTATQALLGVSVQPAPEGGARVQEVTPDGAAAAAGLQPGDVVTQVGDRQTPTSDALVAAVRSSEPGSQVELTVTGAGGESRRVGVTLGSQEVGER